MELFASKNKMFTKGLFFYSTIKTNKKIQILNNLNNLYSFKSLVKKWIQSILCYEHSLPLSVANQNAI